MAEPVVTKPAVPTVPPPEPRALVVNQLGELSEVNRTDLSRALAEDPNLRVATDSDVKANEEQKRIAQIREQYDDPLYATAAGVARGSTFGLSDYLYTKTTESLAGPEEARRVREELAGLQIANPGWSTAGELGGSLLNPVARAAGGVAGSLATRGLSAATGRILPAGLARATTTIGSLAMQAGVENALFEAGSKVSEDVIGDVDMTAEQLWGALGHGFVSGAKLGAALGAGTVIASSAGGYLARKIGGVAGVKKYANELAFDSLELGAPEAKRYFKDGESLRAGRQKWGDVALSEVADDGLPIIHSKVKSVDEINARIAQAEQRAFKEMKHVQGAPERAGAVFDTTPVFSKLEGLLDDVSVMKTVLIDGQAVVRRVPKAGLRADFSELSTFLKDLEREFGTSTSFNDMLALRRRVDAKINWHANPYHSTQSNVMESIFKKARSVVEAEVELQGTAALGASWASEYKIAKQRWGTLEDMYNATSRADMRAETRRTFGLSEQIASHGGAQIGSRIGAMVGGLPGGLIGGMLGGAIGAQSNLFARTRLPQIAASTLDKLSKINALAGTAGTFQSNLDKAVRSFVSGKVHSAIAAKRSFSNKDFEKISTRIHTLKNNPELLAQEVSKVVDQKVQEVAPKIALSLVQTAQRKIGYLADSLPMLDYVGDYLRMTRARQPSTMDITSFFRKLEIAENPLAVFDLAYKKRLTRDHVDALEKIYPLMANEFKKAVIAAYSSGKSKMSRQHKAQMSLLLNMPIDRTQEPDFIREIQSIHDELSAGSSGQAGGADSSGPAPRSPIHVSDDVETVTDRVSDL